ncbi:MAG: hypothetical protein Q7U28_12040 [Aquabacterium sp.]|nr:hypothetical protein [Aquabacterium sp.]
MSRIKLLCFALAMLAGVPLLTVGAQEIAGITDPTRAPPGVLLKTQGGAGPSGAGSGAGAEDAAMAASGAASAASAAAPPPAKMVLGAIRYDIESGMGVALLDGQAVMVGAKVGGMTVLSITRNEVMLKGHGGIKRLTLIDETDKSGPPAAKTARRGRKEIK